MRHAAFLAKLLALIALPTVGRAQIPAVGTLLLEDTFGGSAINPAIWQEATPSASVSGGSLRIPFSGSGMVAHLLYSGDVLVVEYDEVGYPFPSDTCFVEFEALIAPETGTPATVMGVKYSSDDVVSGPTVVDRFTGFRVTVGGTPVATQPPVNTPPPTRVTLVLQRTKAEVYENGVLRESVTITGYPAGPYMLSVRFVRFTGVTFPMTVGRVRAWTPSASSTRRSQAAPPGATTNVAFPSLGWTGAITNNSPYSTMIRISETPAATLAIPQPAVIGGKYFTLDGIGGIVTPATANLSYTFPESQLTTAGVSLGSLKVWKRDSPGAWAQIPATFTDLGTTIRADITNVTSFSDFVVMGGAVAGAESWSTYE